MSEWSIKALKSLTFSEPEDDDLRQRNYMNYNAWGWPEEPESSSRLIVFSENSTYGAYLYGHNTVILFKLDYLKGAPKAQKQHFITCKESITTMNFGPRRGISVLCNKHGTGAESGDFVLATGHLNGEIRIWDASTSQLITSLISHTRHVSDVCFSPRLSTTVQLISVSTDKSLKVWDFEETGANMSQTKVHSQPLTCLAWSPGGKLIATAGEGRLVYLYRKGEKVNGLAYVFRGHASSIVSVKFTPDGTLLVTASVDTRANIWDCLTGSLRQTLCHAYPIPQLIFGREQIRTVDIDPFFTSVVTVAEDRKLRVWNPLKSCLRASLHFLSDENVESRLNIQPEFELDLVEDGDYCCTYAAGGKMIAISSNELKKIHLYSLNVGIPTLSHFCRMVIRRSLAKEDPGLNSLNLPRAVRQYLSYEY